MPSFLSQESVDPNVTWGGGAKPCLDTFVMSLRNASLYKRKQANQPTIFLYLRSYYWNLSVRAPLARPSSSNIKTFPVWTPVPYYISIHLWKKHYEKRSADSLRLVLPWVRLSWWCPEMLVHSTKSGCYASWARAGTAPQRENSGMLPCLCSPGSQHPIKWFLTLNSSYTCLP